MDESVASFFTKDPTGAYLDEYDRSHGPRLDALVARYDLNTLPPGTKVLDVGGGLGFLGKRLPSHIDYWVVDGADIIPAHRLCVGSWLHRDLDHDAWGDEIVADAGGPFDICFCLETLEHIGNPHFAIEQIKKAVKVGGTVVISVPPISVTHNVPYTGLLWPDTSFRQFLGQMALPVAEQWEYVPQTVGWPATHYLAPNLPYTEKTLMFPKQESKFLDCTPLAATNL